MIYSSDYIVSLALSFHVHVLITVMASSQRLRQRCDQLRFNVLEALCIARHYTCTVRYSVILQMSHSSSHMRKMAITMLYLDSITLRH